MGRLRNADQPTGICDRTADANRLEGWRDTDSTANLGRKSYVHCPNSSPLWLWYCPTKTEMERQISRTVALLVDDDLGILFVMAQLIEEAGYAVRTAANGEAALAILSSTDIIDLVISDIVMPGMDGIAFAERAQAIRPGIRLALISGHVQKVRIGLDVTVFEKPFRPTDLLQWLASQSTQADAPPPFPADRSSLRRRGGSG